MGSVIEHTPPPSPSPPSSPRSTQALGLGLARVPMQLQFDSTGTPFDTHGTSIKQLFNQSDRQAGRQWTRLK